MPVTAATNDDTLPPAANDDEPPPEAVQVGLGATDELRQHHRITTQTIVHEDAAGRTSRRRVHRNADFDTLSWLIDRRHIDGDQHGAGNRLRAAWYAAGYEQLQAIDPAHVGGGVVRLEAEPERRLDAQDEVARIGKAVGRRQWALLQLVCCSGVKVSMREVEAQQGAPPNAGPALIRMALDRLREHYDDERGTAPTAANDNDAVLQRWQLMQEERYRWATLRLQAQLGMPVTTELRGGGNEFYAVIHAAGRKFDLLLMRHLARENRPAWRLGDDTAQGRAWVARAVAAIQERSGALQDHARAA